MGRVEDASTPLPTAIEPETQYPYKHKVDGKNGHVYQIKIPPTQKNRRAGQKTFDGVMREYEGQHTITVTPPFTKWLKDSHKYKAHTLKKHDLPNRVTVFRLKPMEGRPDIGTLEEPQKTNFKWFPEPIRKNEASIQELSADLKWRAEKRNALRVFTYEKGRMSGRKREQQTPTPEEVEAYQLSRYKQGCEKQPSLYRFAPMQATRLCHKHDHEEATKGFKKLKATAEGQPLPDEESSDSDSDTSDWEDAADTDAEDL